MGRSGLRCGGSRVKKHRILILGGGFGGVFAARRMEQIFRHRDDIEVTLVCDENFLLFTPMLPEVVSSSIEAKHIVSPLRALLRRVNVHNSQVRSIDLEKRVVVTWHCEMCGSRELEFDHLVLALGSVTHFHGLPGASEHGHPLKTLSDAMALRNHILDVFEHADMEEDPAIRADMLTFVVAGGGFAGTETVAELHDFADTARQFYPNIKPADVRVVLVHSGARIMPEIGEALADYAFRKLQGRGIEVLLGVRVSSVGNTWIELTNGQRIATKTLIWTAGVTQSPLLATLPVVRSKRDRLVVDKYLQLPGYPGLWALGDCAEVPNGLNGECPPTAQHAIRQGKVIAENIAATIDLRAMKAFAYKPLGMLSSLGRRSAVAEICGFRFSGFVAWWLWRTIYLLKLPGLERKVRVALDWTLDLFFPRDIVLLKFFRRQISADLATIVELSAEPVRAETSGILASTRIISGQGKD